MNPTPIDIKPRVLTTAIAVAQDFRLSNKQAHAIIQEVDSSVKQWQNIALKLVLSKRECDRMESAFEYDQ